MNEHSSRSHTILTVHIHSEEKASSGDNNGVFITRNGKINFVDLAGYVLHIIKTIMYISICIINRLFIIEWIYSISYSI